MIKSAIKVEKYRNPSYGNTYADVYYIDRRLNLIQFHAAMHVLYDDEQLDTLDGDNVKLILTALEKKISSKKQDAIDRFIKGDN